jgi:hypothetical protein
MNKSALFSLALMGAGICSGVSDAAAQTVCTRDEQRGCLTFQIVGVEPDANLINKVSNMSASDQAKSFGPDVLEGMVSGRYDASASQDYYLVIWMDAEWGNQPLPADRIRQVCYDDLGGGKTYYQPRGRQFAGIPPIKTASGNVKAHSALAANCSGGVGAGWIIPNDVAQHMFFAMICADGATHYPFQKGGRQEGVVHSGAEIQWYLDRGWEYVLTAAIWQ